MTVAIPYYHENNTVAKCCEVRKLHYHYYFSFWLFDLKSVFTLIANCSFPAFCTCACVSTVCISALSSIFALLFRTLVHICIQGGKTNNSKELLKQRNLFD